MPTPACSVRFGGAKRQNAKTEVLRLTRKLLHDCSTQFRGTLRASGGPRMSIVVILCTYNRCDALVNALNSVAGSEVPDQIRWEVLVVDNNSTDRTREVVEEFSQKYPGRFR